MKELYMTMFLRSATRFWKDESGAGAIEYGLIAALIAVAIIAALTTVGGELKTLFTDVSSELKKRPKP
jgi:pilus assembly protein Flp/PilA